MFPFQYKNLLANNKSIQYKNLLANTTMFDSERGEGLQFITMSEISQLRLNSSLGNIISDERLSFV